MARGIKVCLYFLLIFIMALPLFGFRLPKLLPSMWLLVIHEFSGFIFVGHTVFSNTWSMRIRQTQGIEAGIWARGFTHKLYRDYLHRLATRRKTL